MKHLKYFESQKGFRELNIKDLWLNFIKHKKQIIPIDTGLKTTNLSKLNNWSVSTSDLDEFKKLLLDPILKYKEIAFHKTANKYYGDTSYAFYGRVNEIYIKDDRDRYGAPMIAVVVNLFDDKNTYILSKFQKSNTVPGKDEDVVKVYNSQITDIEETLHMLNNTEKYNL